MGIFSKVFRPKALAPTDDSWYFPGGAYYGGNAPLMPGLPYTSDTAMRLITVQNCVRVRAATISSLPIHTFENLGGDDFKEATDFYLYKLLNDRPNSWMQSPIFWAMVETFVCMRGNFIAYKIGLENRPIFELIPITDRVEKVTQNRDYSLTYHIRFPNGNIEEVPQTKVMHIRGLLTFDGISGVNPIEYARETVGVGTSSTRFLSNYFGKGLHPSAVIEYPQNLDPVTHANLWEAYRRKYGGLANSQDLMLLDNGMKIQFPTIKLVDAQYLELMKMNESQINGLFRTPLMLTQSGDKTPTFASAEQFDLNYVKYGVAPDCRNYEKTIQSDLMTEAEQKKYFVKFNVDALLRGDFDTRMRGFQTAINTEVMNPNEVRKKMELPPYKGGDEYRTRTSTIKESDKVKPTDNKENKSPNEEDEE